MKLLKFLKKIWEKIWKKRQEIPYDERIIKFLHQQYIAECDKEQMKRFLADLDAYGLKYHFRSNISTRMKVKGTKVIDGDEEKDKEDSDESCKENSERYG